MKNKHIGSDFDSFLREEGMFEAVEQGARKKGLAIDLRRIMRAQRVSEAELARRMGTSRTAVRRILDPRQHGTQLDSLARLAGALGYALDIRVLRERRAGKMTSPSGRNVKRAA